jgi:hypothetical protein
MRTVNVQKKRGKSKLRRIRHMCDGPIGLLGPACPKRKVGKRRPDLWRGYKCDQCYRAIPLLFHGPATIVRSLTKPVEWEDQSGRLCVSVKGTGAYRTSSKRTKYS